MPTAVARAAAAHPARRPVPALRAVPSPASGTPAGPERPGPRTGAGPARRAHLRVVAGGERPASAGRPSSAAVDAGGRPPTVTAAGAHRAPVRGAADAPVPGAGTAVRRRALRPTRRGRLVVTVVTAVVAGAGLAGLATADATTPAAPEPVAVVVEPGETLWSLARRVAPGQDPRPVVEQLRRLNGMEGAGLAAGQRLLLPGR